MSSSSSVDDTAVAALRTANGAIDLLDGGDNSGGNILPVEDPNEINLDDEDIEASPKKEEDPNLGQYDDNDDDDNDEYIISDNQSNTTSDDGEEEEDNSAPPKPSIATVAAIVNSVLREKEGASSSSVIDVAAIASKEVEKFYEEGLQHEIEQGILPPPPPSSPSPSPIPSNSSSNQKRSHKWKVSVDETRTLFGKRGTKAASIIMSARIKSAINSSGPRGRGRNSNNSAFHNNATTADKMERAMMGMSTSESEDYDPDNNMNDMNENNPDFNDLCEELGITNESHPQFRSPYNHQTFTFDSSSTKCKQYCTTITCILVSIAIVIASSTVSKSKDVAQQNNHVDNDELNSKWIKDKKQPTTEVKKWWIDSNNDGTFDESELVPIISNANMRDMPSDEIEKLSYKLSDAYLPVWFDRGMGWNGTTYGEAMVFCEGHFNFVPCPYEMFCPGSKELIFNEQFDDVGLSWAPVIDNWNEWVQVGNDGVSQCAAYSGVYKERPTVEFAKHLTRHIMCCLAKPLEDVFEYNGGGGIEKPPNVEQEHGEGVDDPIPPPPPGALEEDDDDDEEGGQDDTTTNAGIEIDVPASGNPNQGVPIGFSPADSHIEPSAAGEHDFQQLEDNGTGWMEKTLNPIWFSSVNGGWSGSTYGDALAFCDERGKELCPEVAVCPEGPMSPPFKGVDSIGDSSSNQWVPVINNWNMWVLIDSATSNDLQCMDYKALNANDEPSWGLDGSDPGLKRNILCCKKSGTTTSLVLESNDAQTSDASVPDDTIDTIELDGTMFSVANGWNGGSHSDAEHFCALSTNQINGQKMSLCPYAAYCPRGPTSDPTEGCEINSNGEEQWAPVADGDNEWVLISPHAHNKNTQCLSYEQVFGLTYEEAVEAGAPAWGLSSDNKNKKRCVMCCPDLTS